MNPVAGSALTSDIHQREIAEAQSALALSEERLRRLAQAGRIGLFEWSTAQGGAYWSPEAYELFGVEPGTPITFERWLACVHPEDRASATDNAEHQQQVRAGARSVSRRDEYRVVHPDGNLLWLETVTTLSAIGDDVLLRGAVRDITDRKLAEEALRESEARLRLVQRLAGAGVWSWDIATGSMEWSDELFVLFGLDPRTERASFDTWRSLLHPEDRDQARRSVDQAMSDGTPLASEYRVILPSGTVRWILHLGDTTNDRQPPRMSGICLDITRGKTAEAEHRRTEGEAKVAQAVQAQRQRLFDVLEALPVRICLLTPDHQVAFANRGFREAFGQCMGRRCYEYCFGSSEPCEFCQTYDVLTSGQPKLWEATTPDGHVIEVHNFPFADADGSPMILEMNADVTETRRIAQELEDANAALARRALQLRALASELTLTEKRERRRLARILHDRIQQLLVAAKLRVATIGRTGDASIHGMSDDVEELLRQAISEARGLTAELSPPVLHDSGLVAGLRWLARWTEEKHGLVVDLTASEDLPRLAEDASVLLFESVRELLFNVVKHASATPAIVSVSREATGNFQITVVDRGPGFDPGALGEWRETSGGFGLVSIRERLGLLDGRMDIESAPGQGSRVTLTVPLCRIREPRSTSDARASNPEEGVAGTPGGTARAGRPIRVVLADDHPVFREGLRQLLGQEPDIDVAGEAKNGREAIDLADVLRPDVILMDVSMPGLDGIEATRAIARDRPEIRVIGLSMFTEADRAQAMLEAGAATYFTKSGSPSDLLAAIRRVAQVG
jgi:PAS domain S-box-containing protein